MGRLEGYEVWLCTATGRRIMPLHDRVEKLQYLKGVNRIGQSQIELVGLLNPNLLKRDRIIQVYRTPAGGRQALDYLGFLLRWRFEADKNGLVTTHLSAPDQNDLIRRRIVAYKAGTSQTLATIAADNAMKDVIAENLGASATDTARNLTGAGLAVQGDLSAGVALSMAFAWRTVDRVLEDMHLASRTDGTAIYYGVEVTGIAPDGSISLEFKTYGDPPGQDRTWSGGSVRPLIFSERHGSLARPMLEYDYRDEINYVYAGGPGQEDARRVQEASDAASISMSPWGRIEAFVDARTAPDTDAAVLDVANAALAEGRAKQRFWAQLLDTEQIRYGRDWFIGDKVTAYAFDREFDGIARIASVTVTPGGEQVEAYIEGEYDIQ